MAPIPLAAGRLRGTELPRLLSARTAYIGAAAVGVAVHASYALTGSSSRLVDDWLYCGLYLLAVCSCAYRARRGDARFAWAIATAGVGLWAAAEIVFRVLVASPTAWYPRASQTLLFAAYFFAYITLAVLARERVSRFDAVLALDGVLGGLAAAAVAAVLLFPALTHERPHGPAAPPQLFLVGALIGLMFVVAVVGMTGWRPGRSWTVLVIAIVVNVVGDAVLVHLSNVGTFHRGSTADTLFVASALLLGLAAFYPNRYAYLPRGVKQRLPAPLLSAAAALSVLIVAVAGGAGGLAAGLAAAALVMVIARMSIALELLERSRSQALTDDLTGLGNRRLLLRDLNRRLAPGSGRPFVLALFDLDGFKRYNDTFGHPSGDALLVRLAARLAEAVAPGAAYRMGGDEFCAIIEGAGARASATMARAQEALCERGDAFSIVTSSGSVECPAEAADVPAALRAADSRMYASKTGRALEQIQTRDAVLTMLDERDPALYEHVRAVGSLAARVAIRLGLDETLARHIERAGELHDIGKVAVPDAILHKPGPLDADELLFIRRYPLVGERIVRAAPSLAPVAPLVRSVQERWDGKGYPDGLVGAQAPLGARILAACDAYDSMRSEHPYRAAASREQAIAELRRCAGSQFDPVVVRALCAELESAENAVVEPASGEK